jgi:serine/threonine protein kinase
MLNDGELGRLRDLMKDPKPARSVPVPGAPSKGKIGKYSLLKLLGPNVWMCTETSMPHALVLRILGITRDAVAVQELCADLKAIVGLHHPVLVTYHKLSTVEGNYFVVRDFIEGRSLAETTLEPAEALQAFYEIARAVEFAHERGVTHGTVSATNVIIDPAGRPFLIDIGSARLRMRFRPRDSTPLTIDTPERDVQGLAGLFWMAMAGSTASRVAASPSELPRLRSISDEVDPALQQMAARLVPGPKIRFSTSGEVAEETARILMSMPQHSSGLGLMEKFRRAKEG